MNNLISQGDYLLCHTHGVIVENMEQHRRDLLSGNILSPDKPCMITSESYVIKNTRKRRIEQLPANVIETMGMKIYHPNIDKRVVYKQDMLPEGSVIINKLESSV